MKSHGKQLHDVKEFKIGTYFLEVKVKKIKPEVSEVLIALDYFWVSQISFPLA